MISHGLLSVAAGVVGIAIIVVLLLTFAEVGLGFLELVAHNVGTMLELLVSRFTISVQVSRANYRLSKTISRRAFLAVKDLEVDDNLAEVLGQANHIRAAAILGNEARVSLKFPKYSAANELIVADWLNRNAPTDMTPAMRRRVFPLAIKLAFIKSKSEVEAGYIFSALGSMVDSA